MQFQLYFEWVSLYIDIMYIISILRYKDILEIKDIKNISTYHPPKCMTLKKNKKNVCAK